MLAKFSLAFAAAVDAVVAAAVTVAICIVPLSILWFVESLTSVGWDVYWRAAGAIWLLGNGVPFTVTAQAASLLPLGSSFGAFSISLMPLALTAVGVWLGVGSGRRASDAPVVWPAWAGAFAGYGVCAAVIATTSRGQGFGGSYAQPIWAAVVPGLMYGAAVAYGTFSARGARQLRLESLATPMVRAAVRAAATAVVALVAVGAIVASILLIAHIGPIITVYQGLHLDLWGAVTVTLGQLAYVPTIVIWTIAWLSGAGFAVGAGSLVSPIGAQLGPLPAVPVLAAMPVDAGAFGYAFLLIPALVFAVILLRASREGPLHTRSVGQALAATAWFAVAVAVLLGAFAALAAGSFGPGRLATVGPNPWAVGVWTFVTAFIVGAAVLVGTVVRPQTVPSQAVPSPEPPSEAVPPEAKSG